MKCPICAHDTETCERLHCSHYGHDEGNAPAPVPEPTVEQRQSETVARSILADRAGGNK